MAYAQFFATRSCDTQTGVLKPSIQYINNLRNPKYNKPRKKRIVSCTLSYQPITSHPDGVYDRPDYFSPHATQKRALVATTKQSSFDLVGRRRRPTATPPTTYANQV